MSDAARTGDLIPLGQPGTDGRFFTCYFDAEGLTTADAAKAVWTWRSYQLTDLAARQALANTEPLPTEARHSFLSPGADSHIEFDDGWLHGDLPDLRHDYSVEARGLGHFRFAFSATALIDARKQPLDSIERVREAIANRSRAFKTPADLFEAIVLQSLEGMAQDLSTQRDLLDGIEDRIVADTWQSERQALVDARRKLVLIHRQMATLVALFRQLDPVHQHELPEQLTDIAARLSHRVHSIYRDVEQVQAQARLLQDEIMANLSAQSNRLLYVLSVMTAVLLPMTIISGLFGMNVESIPFSSEIGGFWMVLAISMAAAGGAYMLVRRIGGG